MGRAALNRAYKRGEITVMPFVLPVKVQYGAPQGRPLKLEEVATLLSEAPDHLWLFMMILIGTACRPDAALSLSTEQLDFESRLIELNPSGRMQTKKIRPIVKMPEMIAAVLRHAPAGRLIQFKGRPVESVKTSWRNLRARCGFGQGRNALLHPPHYGPVHEEARVFLRGKWPLNLVTSRGSTEPLNSMPRSTRAIWRTQFKRLMAILAICVSVACHSVDRTSSLWPHKLLISLV